MFYCRQWDCGKTHTGIKKSCFAFLNYPYRKLNPGERMLQVRLLPDYIYQKIFYESTSTRPLVKR